MKFCFVIPSYNNSLIVKQNLESVIRQTYTNWRAIYINDCSTDDTHDLFFEIVKQYNVESKFTYIKNDRRMGQMYNKYTAYKLVGDFEIVCILDGDDWLSGPDALSIIAKEYASKNIEVTYGNALSFFPREDMAFWAYYKFEASTEWGFSKTERIDHVSSPIRMYTLDEIEWENLK
jgi:glycosyltransferase involved in cell wall biosynthesis